MPEVDGILIDEKKAQLMLRKIILLESKNIRTKTFNKREMVEKIKRVIEEEVECF